jgi:hypothetical protein
MEGLSTSGETYLHGLGGLNYQEPTQPLTLLNLVALP